MENYIFLILVAVVGLIRWISQAAENKRNAEVEKRGGTPAAPSTTPAPTRGAPQSEEERVRKFFEALGLPTTESPPPKVQPRPVAPQPTTADRKFQPVDPFPVPRGRAVSTPPAPAPVMAAPPPLPRVTPKVVQTVTLPTRETTVLAAPVALPGAISDYQVQEIGADVVENEERAVNTYATRLATPQGLREAIVLREVFGPPRSMQPHDLTTVG